MSASSTGAAEGVAGAPRYAAIDRVAVAARPAAVPRSKPAAAPALAAAERPRTVVIVVIDGVRWQEVFAGSDEKLGARRKRADELMPNLWRLSADGGAFLGAPGHGSTIQASGPGFKSTPGYMEILSGRPQRCLSNDCPPHGAPTLADEIALAADAKPDDVVVLSSWKGLLGAVAQKPKRVVMSAGRYDGTNLERLRSDEQAANLLDEGRRTGSPVRDESFRRDRITAALALHWLEHHQPRFLFVSLGEADEFGHVNSYSSYLKALTESDAFVGDVARVLDAMSAAGRPTLLLVTTDHGRDKKAINHGPLWPESGRTWLFARGAGIQARGFVDAPRRRHLCDIAPTVRSLLGLGAPDPSAKGRLLEELLVAPEPDVSAPRAERVAPEPGYALLSRTGSAR